MVHHHMTSPRLDELPQRRRKRLRRRLKEVPVLPSLVTLANLFLGFLAMAKVTDALRLAAPGADFTSVLHYFEVAVLLVFAAMVCDALDGRVARMTGQTSNFGAQLDSLSDMVTFGVVPAFLAKVLVDWHAQADANRLLPVHPKLFYGAAAVYVMGAALRLARFNVETGADEEDHREFRGLPSPAAAAVVCSLVAMFCTRDGEAGELSKWLFAPHHYDWIVMAMPAVLVVLGVLMISRVRYPHAVYALQKGRNSMPMLLGLILLLSVAALEWQLALVVVTSGFVLAGPVLSVYRAVLRRGPRDDDDDDDDIDADGIDAESVGPFRRAPSRN